jgi:signal transduction histidine kinase
MGHFIQFAVGFAGKIRLNHRRILFLVLSAFLLASCAKNEDKDSLEYSDAFKPVFGRTTHFFDINKPDAGIYYLDSAFSKIKKPAVNDKFRFYGFHYVLWQKAKHDYKRAMLYADSMLIMAKESQGRAQYVANVAEANYAKGDTYFSLQQYNDAYQCYFQGYVLGKHAIDQRSLADYTYRMGMIMYKQDHYNLAANYFKESYEQSRDIPDDFPQFYRKQELLDNIAISLKHTGDIDSSVAYFNKALNYITANTSRFRDRAGMLEIAKGVIYGNLAEALILKGQNAPAREYLKKSIAINLAKGGDNHDAELAEMKLGQLFLINHKSDSLFALLNRVRGQLDTVKNESAEAEWNRLMGSYYQQKQELGKAFVYVQRYNSLKDSTIKRLSSLKESDVNQQLANFEKQYEIETLSSNNKVQKIYLTVAIVCAAMLLLIIALVWRNWKQSKFDVQVSIALNKQISEQKVDLEGALDEVKLSSQEKDRILHAVAHDLRNPLGGIASLTAVMVEEYQDDKELAGQLKLIKDTATDSLELINEILEATKGETAGQSRQWVDVNALINNSVELLRFKAAEKHQQILIDGLNADVELHINRERIWRVISNLISNAIKFSAVDSVIKVKAVQKQNNVIISVKDHGIGIPENMKDKVFHMFTNAKRPGTIGEKSFGLGLSISKQIIEKHEGRIWFESEVNKGTTFYISLPKTHKKDGHSQNSIADKQLVTH